MELLERAPFLDTLGEYAAAARQGDGRLVLVSGESGIGKTVLLEEFQRRTTGTRWLWGACDGLLTPRPLGPLFDIAAQAGEALGPWRASGERRATSCSGPSWPNSTRPRPSPWPSSRMCTGPTRPRLTC